MRRSLLLSWICPLLLLAACNGKDEDTGPFDEDGDGIEARADCDDQDPALATPSRYYEDADGDGYGNAESAKIRCGPSEGWVADQTDCDDNDPATHPGAPEYCDGTGDDCDSDHSTIEKVDSVTLYPDWDGDGYGNPNQPTVVCPGTVGFLEDRTDCNDTDPTVNPTAEEVCVDHEDDNCDGLSDGCDAPLGDQPTLSGTAGDLTGTSVAGVNDVTDDGVDDLLVGAPGAGGAGGAWLVAGPLTGDVNLGRDALFLAGPIAGSLAGWSVAGGRDLDGDGVDDLAVGAPASTSTESGRVYVVAGPVTEDLSLSEATTTIRGAAGDRLGISLIVSEDITNDRRWDLVAGATGSSAGGLGSGAAYIFSGGGGSGDRSLDDATAAFIGAAGTGFGHALAMPRDVTGDGYSDLAISALSEGDKRGLVYVFEGPFRGTVSAADALATLTGESRCDRAGYALAMAGDMNLDGYKDLLVGAPVDDSACGSEDAGKAYVVFGPIARSASLADAGVKILGVTDEDHAGMSLANVKDSEGDGYSDFVIGAPGADREKGRAYLLLGPLEGTVELSRAALNYIGGATGDLAGASVAIAGDIDDDSRFDVVLGAPGASAAYLYFGTTTW
jgi:hypothetical protein